MLALSPVAGLTLPTCLATCDLGQGGLSEPVSLLASLPVGEPAFLAQVPWILVIPLAAVISLAGVVCFARPDRLVGEIEPSPILLADSLPDAGGRIHQELIDDYRKRIGGDTYAYVHYLLPLLSSKAKDAVELRVWDMICKDLITDYIDFRLEQDYRTRFYFLGLLDEVELTHPDELGRDPTDYFISHMLVPLLEKIEDIRIFRLCKGSIDYYLKNLGDPYSYIRYGLPAQLASLEDMELLEHPTFPVPVKLNTFKYEGDYAGWPDRWRKLLNRGALRKEVQRGRMLKRGNKHYLPFKNPVYPTNRVHNRALCYRSAGRDVVYKGLGASGPTELSGLIVNLSKGSGDQLLYGGLPRSESSIEVDLLLRRTYRRLSRNKNPALMLAERHGARIDMFRYPIAEAMLEAVPVVVTKNISERAKLLLQQAIVPDQALALPKNVKLIPIQEYLDFIGIPPESEERQPVIYVYSVPCNLRMNELQNTADLEPIFSYYNDRMEYRNETAEQISTSFGARCALFISIVHFELNGYAPSIFTGHNVGPLAFFDYDTIKINANAQDAEKAYAEERKEAKARIKQLAGILGVDSEKALAIFDEILKAGAAHIGEASEARDRSQRVEVEVEDIEVVEVGDIVEVGDRSQANQGAVPGLNGSLSLLVNLPIELGPGPGLVWETVPIFDPMLLVQIPWGWQVILYAFPVVVVVAMVALVLVPWHNKRKEERIFAKLLENEKAQKAMEELATANLHPNAKGAVASAQKALRTILSLPCSGPLLTARLIKNQAQLREMLIWKFPILDSVSLPKKEGLPPQPNRRGSLLFAWPSFLAGTPDAAAALPGKYMLILALALVFAFLTSAILNISEPKLLRLKQAQPAKVNQEVGDGSPMPNVEFLTSVGSASRSISSCLSSFGLEFGTLSRLPQDPVLLHFRGAFPMALVGTNYPDFSPWLYVGVTLLLCIGILVAWIMVAVYLVLRQGSKMRNFEKWAEDKDKALREAITDCPERDYLQSLLDFDQNIVSTRFVHLHTFANPILYRERLRTELYINMVIAAHKQTGRFRSRLSVVGYWQAEREIVERYLRYAKFTHETTRFDRSIELLHNLAQRDFALDFATEILESILAEPKTFPDIHKSVEHKEPDTRGKWRYWYETPKVEDNLPAASQSDSRSATLSLPLLLASPGDVWTFLPANVIALGLVVSAIALYTVLHRSAVYTSHSYRDGVRPKADTAPDANRTVSPQGRNACAFLPALLPLGLTSFDLGQGAFGWPVSQSFDYAQDGLKMVSEVEPLAGWPVDWFAGLGVLEFTGLGIGELDNWLLPVGIVAVLILGVVFVRWWKGSQAKFQPIVSPHHGEFNALFSEKERGLLEELFNQLAEGEDYPPAFLLWLQKRLIPGITIQEVANRKSSWDIRSRKETDLFSIIWGYIFLPAFCISWGFLVFGCLSPDLWAAVGGMTALGVTICAYMGLVLRMPFCNYLFVSKVYRDNHFIKLPLLSKDQNASSKYVSAAEEVIHTAFNRWDRSQAEAANSVFHSLFSKGQKGILCAIFEQIASERRYPFLKLERLKRTLIPISSSRLPALAEEIQPGYIVQKETVEVHKRYRNIVFLHSVPLLLCAFLLFGPLGFLLASVALCIIYTLDLIYTQHLEHRGKLIRVKIQHQQSGDLVIIPDVGVDSFRAGSEMVIRHSLAKAEEIRLLPQVTAFKKEKQRLEKWRNLQFLMNLVCIILFTTFYSAEMAGWLLFAYWIEKAFSVLVIFVVCSLIVEALIKGICAIVRYISKFGKGTAFIIKLPVGKIDNSKIGVVWIRDGTLVEKMHIVIAATAIAAREYMEEEKRQVYSLEYLINKFFEYSGLNTMQKLVKFEEEHGRNIFTSIDDAVELYNEYMAKDYKGAGLFKGAGQLLKKLQATGVRQFLISGYPDEDIKQWLNTETGKEVGECLEVYGERKGDGIVKGRSQFDYIRSKYGIERFYFVADAVSEMELMRHDKADLNLTLIGFANCISPELVAQAVEEITKGAITIDTKKLKLPNQIKIDEALNNSGADKTVTDMGELEECFRQQGWAANQSEGCPASKAKDLPESHAVLLPLALAGPDGLELAGAVGLLIGLGLVCLLITRVGVMVVGVLGYFSSSRFPDSDISKAREVRIIGGNSSDTMLPHQSQIERIVGQEPILLANSLGQGEALLGQTPNCDVHFGNGRDGFPGTREPPDIFGMTLQIGKGFTRSQLIVFNCLGEHKPMPNLGKNKDRSKGPNLLAFNRAQQLSAGVSQTQEMVDEDVGVNEDTFTRRELRRHLALQGAELGRFGDEFACPRADVNDGLGSPGNTFRKLDLQLEPLAFGQRQFLSGTNNAMFINRRNRLNLNHLSSPFSTNTTPLPQSQVKSGMFTLGPVEGLGMVQEAAISLNQFVGSVGLLVGLGLVCFLITRVGVVILGLFAMTGFPIDYRLLTIDHLGQGGDGVVGWLASLLGSAFSSPFILVTLGLWVVWLAFAKEGMGGSQPREPILVLHPESNPISSIPADSTKIEQHGRTLYIAPKAQAGMQRLHDFVATRDTEVETYGIGLTRQFDEKTTVVVDFIAPRKDKVFILQEIVPTSFGIQLLSVLSNSQPTTLVVVNNELSLVLDAKEEPLLVFDDSSWPQFQHYLTQLSSKTLPDDPEEVKRLIISQGAIILRSNWDVLVSSTALGNKVWPARQFYDRASQEAVRQQALPSYTLHYHPRRCQEVVELASKELTERQQYYRKALGLNWNDLDKMKSSDAKWFEIRMLGNPETVQDKTRYTSVLYNMDEIDYRAMAFQEALKQLIELPQTARAEELFTHRCTILTHFKELTAANFDPDTIIAYVLGPELAQEYYHRLGNQRDVTSLRDFLLGRVFRDCLFARGPVERMEATTDAVLLAHEGAQTHALWQQLMQLGDTGVVPFEVINRFLYDKFLWHLPFHLDAYLIARKATILRNFIAEATASHTEEGPFPESIGEVPPNQSGLDHQPQATNDNSLILPLALAGPDGLESAGGVGELLASLPVIAIVTALVVAGAILVCWRRRFKITLPSERSPLKKQSREEEREAQNADIVLPIDTQKIPGFKNWLNWNGFSNEHLGFDFAAYLKEKAGGCILGLPEQTEVRAVADGVVKHIAKESDPYYINICIEHEDLYVYEHGERRRMRYSLYQHVVPKVTEGMQVKKGETVIATLYKDSGEEAGRIVHLHFELTENIYHRASRYSYFWANLVNLFPELGKFNCQPFASEEFTVNGKRLPICRANHKRMFTDEELSEVYLKYHPENGAFLGGDARKTENRTGTGGQTLQMLVLPALLPLGPASLNVSGYGMLGTQPAFVYNAIGCVVLALIIGGALIYRFTRNKVTCRSYPRAISFKLLAVISVISIMLFTVIQIFIPELSLQDIFGFKNFPAILSFTNLKIFVSFVVFLTLGEFIGQLINLRYEENFTPHLKRDFNWIKITAIFIYTAVFLIWFLPFTYNVWLSALPKPLVGLSDQILTGVLNAVMIFIIHGLIERIQGKRQGHSTATIVKEKLPYLRQALIFSFTYWSLGLGILFSLPFAFTLQNVIIGLMQPPFAIILLTMANRKAQIHTAIQMNPWAKIVLPLAIIYNFIFYPFIVGISIATLLIGVILYLPALIWGFTKVRVEADVK